MERENTWREWEKEGVITEGLCGKECVGEGGKILESGNERENEKY